MKSNNDFEDIKIELNHSMKCDFDKFVGKFVKIEKNDSVEYFHVKDNLFNVAKCDGLLCDVIELWFDGEYHNIIHLPLAPIFIHDVYEYYHNDNDYSYHYKYPISIIDESEYNGIKNIVILADKKIKEVINS